MPNSRSGFTLIEILCAMGAFILVFLTGSGGLMRLMMQQTNNQQATMAASAAMLLADWHTTIALQHLPTSTFHDNITGVTDASYIIAEDTTHTKATLTNIRFKGTTPQSTEKFYIFKPTAVYPFTVPTITLNAYDQLIFSVSNAGVGSSGYMKFRVVSFWYGDPQSAKTNTSDSFVFVGRYLIPEAF